MPAVLNEQRLIRILHSPSSPEVKGTYLIRQAINALKAKGYPIDYVEIMGKPNTVVIAELEKCDFIVDQLYSDTPMSGFATEAAFFGKTAVVGGYGWQEVEKLFSPNQMKLKIETYCAHYRVVCYPEKPHTGSVKGLAFSQ